MLIRFWGTRGSLPAPINDRAVRAKIHEALLAARGHESRRALRPSIASSIHLPFSVRGTYGGNSSCVEIVTGGDDYVLCDMGSGVREFGNSVLAKYGPAKKNRFNVFMSHLHWDHIMGFPFFTPAYIPGNVIRIHGCHQGHARGLRASAVQSVVSGRFQNARRDHRVRRTRARPHLRN